MGIPIEPCFGVLLKTQEPNELDQLRPELRKWSKTFKFDDSNALALLSRLCKGFNTPYSLWVKNKVENHAFHDVLAKPPLPANYDEPHEYLADRQVWAFLAKYPFEKLTTLEQRKTRALESVLQAEIRCASFNRAIRSEKLPGRAQAVIMTAQRKISRWLGKLNVAEVLRESRFGPGTVQGLQDAKNVSFYHKISGRPTATPGLKPYLRAFFAEHPGWSRSLGLRRQVDDYGNLYYIPEVDFVPTNRVTTVPKTALTDRPIAVECTINQFLQLGTGQAIRRRLKRVGIDLQNGQDLHRSLAELGSRCPWLISTVDLSSASDTIAYELVKLLLPSDWFHWLDLLRAPQGLLPDGSVINYEKFSSMGNGYTFELETLIFLAVVHSVYDTLDKEIPDDLTKVYGDDIICTTDVVPRVMEALEDFGFQVNHHKSFFTAHPFRESCGADFFLGNAVRPVYFSEKIDDPLKMVEAVNRLFTLAGGGFNTAPTDRRYRFAYLYLLDRIPNHLRDGLRSLPGVEGALWAPFDLGQSLYFDQAIQRLVHPKVHLIVKSKTTELDGVAGIVHSCERGSTHGVIPKRGRGQIRLRFTWDTVVVGDF